MGGKIKWAIVFFLILVLFYTRFINLYWGFPYPFHPDERNMAAAIQSLNCSNFKFLQDCFNPHFFAYGQFPLYLGYLFIQIFHWLIGRIFAPISFVEAVMTLRIISAISSIFAVWFMLKIIKQILNQVQNDSLFFPFSLIIFIFSPGPIQFAHFGTTESLLMFFYTGLIYFSIKLLKDKIELQHFILISSLFSGLAIGTKVSSLIFLLIPTVAVFWKKKFGQSLLWIFYFGVLTTAFSIIFSPQNLISFNEFISSIRYESAIATGFVEVFYTRQFLNSVPIIFQFTRIFPYVLGLPVLILFIAGFFILPYKKEINLLRLSFLVYFLPTSFLYTKWTRFMAPVVPLMLIIAALTVYQILNQVQNDKRQLFTVAFLFLTFIFVIPGIAFLSVYTNPDVRFIASEWMYKNIPSNTIILSETGNVVDLPIGFPGNYDHISFNFYGLDQNHDLQVELDQYLKKADYVLIPSRRIFMNHSKQKYPLLNNYYDKLFSEKLGFKKVAEFNSYPKISLFGKNLLEFPDEQAEETFSVFDHPVIRIYKKT